MPAKHSVVVPLLSRIPVSHPNNRIIPAHQIRIIAWSALVVLYGEPG
jgi:hypothetical protein